MRAEGRAGPIDGTTLPQRTRRAGSLRERLFTRGWPNHGRSRHRRACALSNSADPAEILVTVHIYSPPLPEVRRYAVATTPPAAVFLRKKPDGARTVAVIGGGFTGAMTLANLLRRAPKAKGPYHLILLESCPRRRRHRLPHEPPRHLLNVPAGKMSAWPDRPDDFLNFARARDPSTQPGDFFFLANYMVNMCGRRCWIWLTARTRT